ANELSGSAGVSAKSRAKRNAMKQTNKSIGRTSGLSPEQRDDRRGLGFAVAIHAALILFMMFSFIAAPQNPNPVQVELWADGTTPTAAEPEVEPQTEPD